MPLLLVVDDEPNILYTVAETLGSDKLNIVSAGTAREGIEAVRRERPDVVLLDVRLPDMSGLDAFQRMHEIDPRPIRVGLYFPLVPGWREWAPAL